MNPVKERPILFNGPMTCALLNGSKKQTRRTIKSPTGYFQVNSTLDGQVCGVEVMDADENYVRGLLCPYGQPGDRLWVRETFYAWGYWAKRFNEKKQRDEKYFDDLTLQVDEKHLFEYPAEFGTFQKDKMDWHKRPSIFMPRAASRLLLEITAVHVERVCDISEADAIAEGVEEWPYAHTYRDYLSDTLACDNAKDSYESLWRKINGWESWFANPWVWVVEFKIVESK